MTTGDEGKVELPELPEGWTSETYKPWPGLSDKTITTWNKTWEIFEGREMVHSECNFLNDLLTAVYHPTNGLKQQLSDLRQRVEEVEEELHRLKNPEPNRQPQQFTQEEAAELDRALEYWEKTKSGWFRDD